MIWSWSIEVPVKTLNQWGWLGLGGLVEGKWRQLYLNNNKKCKKKKQIKKSRTSLEGSQNTVDGDLVRRRGRHQNSPKCSRNRTPDNFLEARTFASNAWHCFLNCHHPLPLSHLLLILSSGRIPSPELKDLPMLWLPGGEERGGTDSASAGTWEPALPTSRSHVMRNSPKTRKIKVRVQVLHSLKLKKCLR